MSTSEKDPIETDQTSESFNDPNEVDEDWGDMSFLDNHRMDLVKYPKHAFKRRKRRIIVNNKGERVTNPDLVQIYQAKPQRIKSDDNVIQRDETGLGIMIGKVTQKQTAAIEHIFDREIPNFIAFIDAQGKNLPDKWQLFKTVLKDPETANWTLARKLNHAQIGLPELTALYHDSQKMKALWNALESLPDILYQQSQHALDKLILCTACDGAGTCQVQKPDPASTSKRPKYIAVVGTCKSCNGTGKAIQEGSKDAINRILEIAGLSNKKGQQGPPVVNLNFNVPIEESASQVGQILDNVGNIFDVKAES